MTTSQEPNESGLQVDRLFAEYLEGLDRGDLFDRNLFLQKHAACADELQSLIEVNEILVGLRDEAGKSQQDSSQTASFDENANRNAPGTGSRLQFLGDYELLEEIARGGMGVIYKARQFSLGRIVAIKMIRCGDLATAEDIQRFRNEAEAVANLHHRNIVAIHEVGEHEGQYYFSMNFIEGGSLAQLVRENPLPVQEAVAIVQQAAEAVQYAHERGVLHRDIKPSNILIDKNGDVLITDFGLAKRVNIDSNLTQTGQILGTPSYMPPEQAMGIQALMGPACDVYALGAVLYELLTARPPFAAATPIETIQQVLDQESVSPRLLNGVIPRDLETICLKCLEKSPSQRYRTPLELAEELKRFSQGVPIVARPLGRIARCWRWCRRNPVAAVLFTGAAVLLIFVTIESLWLARQREQLLVEEVQRHNRSAAKWVATLVELELEGWRQTVLQAATELRSSAPLLESLDRGQLSSKQMKQQIKQIDPNDKLQSLCKKWQDDSEKVFPGVFTSWYVFNREGVIIALWPPQTRDSIGKHFSGREYVNHHFERPQTKDAHVSPVFLSENDGIFKYAISAAILDDENVFQGVVAGSIAVGPTLGKHKLSEKRQKVVVVGRGDPNPARNGVDAVAQKHQYPVLIHDEYQAGQEPVEFPNHKLWLPSLATSDDEHVDPIYGGRWLAAFEPVENTEFRVVVQQRYREAIPSVLSLSRGFMFWLGVALTSGLLLIAAACGRRLDSRTR